MQLSFGAGFIFGVRTDVANSTPVPLGVLQDTSIEFSGDFKALYGGQKLPVAFARGKEKIAGKSKFARINARLFNDLYFGQTMNAGQTLTAIGEAANVPGSIAYTITAANAANFQTDLGVFYAATGLPFSKVAAAPTAGQYSVSAVGVYTFAVADASAAVQLCYTYTATGGQTITISNQNMGAIPTWKGIFTTAYSGKTFTLSLNYCATQKLNFATKQDDWTIPEMDWEGGADIFGIAGYMSLAE
jgi:hypothetical protein